MARPIDRAVALDLQRQKKIKHHSLVNWNGTRYVIWKDEHGPIYSTPAHGSERKAAVEDTIYIGDVYDTITWRVMNRAERDRHCECVTPMVRPSLSARWL